MPTLSRPSPFRRLASLRRAPFWAQALALCALFAIVGVAVLDDYGISVHDYAQRRIAIANADYIATGDISKLSPKPDPAYQYYGMTFDMPLLLLERAFGLEDTRDIYLTRHLITHLFFIAGGFACGMLAYRMLGSRWIALLAMLLFMLHPRLYAHSFFNVKDIPFAALLVIALYLARRAFRKDTLGAFLLCGIVVGLAINLRPFALMLPPMILAMRALDMWQTSCGAERKRVLMTGAAFLAAAIATVYIIHPYYWENPLRFVEGVRALSQHPKLADNLFMGETYLSNAVPWNFIPVWFAITAPPATLALGAIGCAAACWQAIARPLAALRDREIRFRVLLLGCLVIPVVAAIALQSNIYSGWRHMYFLWAPFCLLAAVGLHSIANIRMGGGIWKVGARLPGWVRSGCRWRMARRALAYGAAGFGLITTLTAMAALHPHQQVYFNALTDTKTPGALARRYDMDYWQIAQRQSLEYLLARYPDGALRVWGVWARNVKTQILPHSDRSRIINAPSPDADFYLSAPRAPYWRDAQDPPTLHSVKAYGSDIARALAPNSAAYRAYYLAEYKDVEANGTPLARSAFDIYAHNGGLRYLSADCAPLLAGLEAGVFLRIVPADPADLPADSRERGFENLDFRVSGRAAYFTYATFFDGKCIIRRPLPDYPIARIATGQKAAAAGGAEWSVDIDFAARAAAQAVHDRILAGDYGAPVAQSHFDLYLSGNALTYLKAPCAPDDTDARFFLHIFPANPSDLPAAARERGFANLDFQFADHGAYATDICLATLDLPDYPIGRIRAGQFVSGEGRVWGVEFSP